VKDLVSIIIPNFNKSDYLEETLLSVLSQSYKNIEIIIVDDGSKDNSINIIKSLAEANKRIQLIQRERKPKGGSTCRNIGIGNAKGKYVFFLDSDDLITATCIEKRIEFIEQKNCDFAVFNTGTFLKAIGDSNLSWKVPKGDYLKMFLSHDLPWNISSVLWKKSALNSLNGFLENFERLQDVELHTRALISNLKYIISDDEMDFFYRIDPERSIANPEKGLINKLKGVAEYVAFFNTELNENKKHLKGTAINAFKDVLYFYDGKDIPNRIVNVLLARIFGSNNSKEKMVLSIYKFLFNNGFYKIKGFNFLFKKVFIYI